LEGEGTGTVLFPGRNSPTLITHTPGGVLHGFFDPHQVSVEQVEARAVFIIFSVKYSQSSKINVRITTRRKLLTSVPGRKFAQKTSAFF
jgi:hypothetical protein